MNLFGRFGKSMSTKSIPANSGLSLESYVMAPKPLQNSPQALINMDTGYVYVCNRVNSSAVGACRYRLYTAVGGNAVRKSLPNWIPSIKADKNQSDWVKKSIPQAYQTGNSEIVEIVDHPVLDLLRRPSDKVDGFSLFELTEQYLGIIGNAYWQIVSKGGKPIAIEILPGEFVMVKLNTDNKIIGYREQINGTGWTKDFDSDEIMHFKQPAPGAFRRIGTNIDAPTGIYGMGHLEGCLPEAQLLESINTYERSLMDNNGRPDFIVKYTQGKLTEDQSKAASTKWANAFKGLRKSGRPAVMDNQFDIQTLGFSPKDLSYQEGKKWLRTSICNAFGVDESFITVENSNRSNSETGLEKYYRFTVLPKLRRIQEVINSMLMPLYDNDLWIVFDDPVPENYQAKIKRDTSDVQLGIMSINEMRKERGMEPYPEAEYDRPQPKPMRLVEQPIDQDSQDNSNKE